MQNLKCDWFISFIQVTRNRTHPVFKNCIIQIFIFHVCMNSLFYTVKLVASYKLYHTNTTDSTVMNIIHIHTVLDIKSKYFKWNVLKLSTEAVVRRYVLQKRSSLKCPSIHGKTSVLDFLIKLQVLRLATLLKSSSSTGMFLSILRTFFKKLL